MQSPIIYILHHLVDMHCLTHTQRIYIISMHRFRSHQRSLRHLIITTYSSLRMACCCWMPMTEQVFQEVHLKGAIFALTTKPQTLLNIIYQSTNNTARYQRQWRLEEIGHLRLKYVSDQEYLSYIYIRHLRMVPNIFINTIHRLWGIYQRPGFGWRDLSLVSNNSITST